MVLELFLTSEKGGLLVACTLWHYVAVLKRQGGPRFVGSFGMLTLPPTNMGVQKGQLTNRKVVFLQGSVHFHVSWWEGTLSPLGLDWLVGRGGHFGQLQDEGAKACLWWLSICSFPKFLVFIGCVAMWFHVSCTQLHANSLALG